jgi:hypothetical protein
VPSAVHVCPMADGGRLLLPPLPVVIALVFSDDVSRPADVMLPCRFSDNDGERPMPPIETGAVKDVPRPAGTPNSDGDRLPELFCMLWADNVRWAPGSISSGADGSPAMVVLSRRL